MSRTSVFGLYDDCYGAIERVSDHLPVPPPYMPRQRFWKIVARRAVLAAGAIDRPIVFGGNDRPGVMLAAAVQSYVNRFAVAPAKRMAFFANNDAAWTAAFNMCDAGGEVAAIVDTRRDIANALWRARKNAASGRSSAARFSPPSGKTLDSIEIFANGRTERVRRGWSGHVGRVFAECPSDLPSWRQAGVERKHRRFYAGPMSARPDGGRGGFRRLCAFRLSGRGREGGRGGRDGPWLRRPKFRPAQSRRRAEQACRPSGMSSVPRAWLSSISRMT